MQSSAEDEVTTVSEVPVTSQLLLPSTTCMTFRPKSALSFHLYDDRTQKRLALLAFTALQCGEASRSGRCSPIWSTVLPQLSCSIPAVTSSLAALGAALESTELVCTSSVATRMTALRQYSNAIRQVQDQIPRQDTPDDALIISCLLLACAEIVQWREINALKHLLGAFELFRCKLPANLNAFPRQSPSEHYATARWWETGVFIPTNDLDILFIQLDIQTASYALGLPPRLPSISLQRLLNMPATERRHSDLELETLCAVHSCYRVAFLMSQYKYTAVSFVPKAVGFEQARRIAELSACLKRLSRAIVARRSAAADLHGLSVSLKQALLLRCQCLAGMIYLSMTSNAYEKGYDALAELFQQILADSQALLDLNADLYTPIEQFSMGLGILEPLFLTAIKWRDPNSRRRAIALLSRCGREGPFHGKLLATIASRAVEVEEKGLESLAKEKHVAADVTETSRLHGVGMATEDVGSGSELRAQITLSRCWNVEAMLAADTRWDDEMHWDVWTESVCM